MNKNIIPIEDYLNIIDEKDILYTEYNDTEYNDTEYIATIKDKINDSINDTMNDTIILNKNHIKLSKKYNGWFKEQLQLLNINFPPPRDWKYQCIGKLYPKDVVRQFINYQYIENIENIENINNR